MKKFILLGLILLALILSACATEPFPAYKGDTLEQNECYQKCWMLNRYSTKKIRACYAECENK